MYSIKHVRLAQVKYGDNNGKNDFHGGSNLRSEQTAGRSVQWLATGSVTT